VIVFRAAKQAAQYNPWLAAGRTGRGAWTGEDVGLKIVSGGQTGVDRAALDAALELGLACGGWCPRGRRAEDGVIAGRYPLRETPTGEYAVRTTWNVRDSDATLILNRGRLSGGSLFTAGEARRLRRPCLVVDPGEDGALATTGDWLASHRPRILNVAGPRESGWPGIQVLATNFLRRLLAVTSH
jgi:hypothetical protein